MNDDELLARLALAFAPEIGAVPQPPPHAIAALHQALAERGNGGVGSVGSLGSPRPARARRRLMAALAGLIATLGGATAAFAAGVPMPDPLRDLAHDVGLPVDSSTLVQGKSIRSALEAAVSRRDAAEASRLAKGLRADLAQLDGDERAQLQAGADGLLEQADTLVAENAGQRAGDTGGAQESSQSTGTQQPATHSAESSPTSSTQGSDQATGGSASAADALLSSASSPFPATTAGPVTTSPGGGSDSGGGASGSTGSQ